MISYLKGKVAYKDLKSVVLDVGGVGYKIAVSPDALMSLEKISEKNESVSFWTYLAVRENALDLYGFINREELNFFEKLITVSGIGPKTAMTILSIATVSLLKKAISTEDSASLIKLSGIGKKNAEKIIIELKDKIKLTEEEHREFLKDESDAVEVLVTLGYSQKEARDTLQKIPKEVSGTADRVKQSLKFLGVKK